MAEKQLEILRGYELRLLRCTLAPPLSDLRIQSQPLNEESQCSLLPLHEHINSLIDSNESGHYIQALYSDAAKLVLHTLDFVDINDSAECADRVYSELLQLVEAFIVNDSENDVDKAWRVILLMCLSVAALIWFTQCNVTGTISWWLTRLLLMHQRILDELSSSLYDLLKVFMAETLQNFGTLVNVSTYWGNQLHGINPSEIVSTFHLEAGLLEHIYRRVDSCSLINSIESGHYLQALSSDAAKHALDTLDFVDINDSAECAHRVYSELLQLVEAFIVNDSEIDVDKACRVILPMCLSIAALFWFTQCNVTGKHFESAEVAAGLQLSVIGVLGFHTVRQVEPKAQMVLVANTSSSNTSDVCPSINQVIHTHDSTIGDASDVFVAPKLLGNSHESESGVQCIHPGGSAAHLKAIQQAVILSRCLLIEKSSRQDEMQRWDMAPYIEAIDSQQSSCFILKFFCDLLCIRWESTGSRTKGRALEMMDKLLLLISVKSIVDVTYCNLGVIVHWMCSLGDVTNNDACYEKALEVSNDKSARAKLTYLYVNRRSLARSAYNRREYETSEILWEAAMAVNSLYPDGWFALGAAALKARDVEKALDGLTRAVQLDPDNGEAWNNIACLNDMLTTQPLSLSLSLSVLVRLCQGSDLRKDRDRFKRFSYASLELCKVYMEISSSSGSRRELFAAEMHLKNGKTFSHCVKSAFLLLYSFLEENALFGISGGRIFSAVTNLI
ncbi:TPR REGION domain-containing protein [Citrus sinensis]|nr:TPR REGION domain-containing protein [Citrus sinensis]